MFALSRRVALNLATRRNALPGTVSSISSVPTSQKDTFATARDKETLRLTDQLVDDIVKHDVQRFKDNQRWYKAQKQTKQQHPSPKSRRELHTSATNATNVRSPKESGDDKSGEDKGPNGEAWPVQQPRTLAGPSVDIAFTGIGCFVGIGTLSAIFHITGSDLVMMVASFGATSTLVFGAPAAPFSQPRSVIGGHLLSASVGLLTAAAMPEVLTVAGAEFAGVALGAPIAVSVAAVGMQLTKTMHPPAGGTALIAVLGSESINGLGFSFLCPVGVSALTLIGLGVIVNNIHPARRHAPKEGRWW